jgi:hypothetical protein
MTPPQEEYKLRLRADIQNLLSKEVSCVNTLIGPPNRRECERGVEYTGQPGSGHLERAGPRSAIRLAYIWRDQCARRRYAHSGPGLRGEWPQGRFLWVRSGLGSHAFPEHATTIVLHPTRQSVPVTFGASVIFSGQAKIAFSDAPLEPQFAPAFLLVARARVPTPVFSGAACAFAPQPVR